MKVRLGSECSEILLLNNITDFLLWEVAFFYSQCRLNALDLIKLFFSQQISKDNEIVGGWWVFFARFSSDYF